MSYTGMDLDDWEELQKNKNTNGKDKPPVDKTPSDKGDTGGDNNTGKRKDTTAQSLAKASDIAKTLANWSPNKRSQHNEVDDVRSGQSGKQFTAVRGGEVDSLSSQEIARLKKLTSGGYG